MPESSSTTANVAPLVRMLLTQLSGMDASLAVPALHAALCEVTRAQVQGDNTVAALIVIENTLQFFRQHPCPMPGLTLSDTPARKDVN